PGPLIKAPSRRLRHPWARPCCPVGAWSTRMTLELTRRMDAPSGGRDLSLYAMLFQEVTANRSDPPNGTIARPPDNILPGHNRKQEGAFSEILTRIKDLSGRMWKCPEPPVLLRAKRFAINQEGLAGTGREREIRSGSIHACHELSAEKKTDDPARLLESFTSNQFEVRASIGQ
ncbi:hypothetical protein M9458_054226, partial [Cirrhinus mrigala]